MGAFETFVNANLGIRKPLISDIGPPSGSLKAAGVIGSEYIDTDSNFLYEKTGENNLSDWVFTRKLGDQSKDEELENSVSIISGNLQALDDSMHSSSFSLPSGASEVSIKYSDLGVVGSYSQSPDINISMISQSSSPPLSPLATRARLPSFLLSLGLESLVSRVSLALPSSVLFTSSLYPLYPTPDGTIAPLPTFPSAVGSIGSSER